MASLTHEELVELLRADPRIAVELVRNSGRVALPFFSSLELRPGELRELLPTERRVDVVILLLDGVPVCVLLVEVQTSIDPGKKRTWPYYLTALRAEYECPVILVVLSPHADVRAWASEPISTGHPGFELKPVVVGPGEVPRVENEAEARQAPYRAVLSALMHVQEEGAEKVALAAFVGVEELEQAEERDMWRELVAQALQSNEVARKALEAMMNVETWREKSIWFQDGRKEGFQDGRKEGKVEEAREAVKDLCEILAIELGAERLQALEAMDLPALASLRKHLKAHRSWPPEGG
jgi:hypothetical protein